MKNDMNTLVFTQRFPDETACREHYRDMRIKQGLTLKKVFQPVRCSASLGIIRDKKVWFLMHRIRTLMGKRDDLYSPTGMIGFDEGFFKIATPEKERKNLKRGKGSQRQYVDIHITEKSSKQTTKTTQKK
jgi:hypothetical protein